MALDIPLILYFAFWYLGNYYYNIQNKTAAIEAGDTKFAMTLSVVQLAVGCVYAIFLWVAPDARKPPQMTVSDYIKMLPSGFLMAGAHAASVFSLAAGGVAFAQIVKAAEPAFTAVISCFIYGKSLSFARWCCLIPIILGVALAALKMNDDGSIDLDFTVGGLVGASLANLFAGFKSNEIKRLMTTPGIKDRIGSTGNQFAVQTIIALIMLIPLMIWRERDILPEFVELFQANTKMSTNLVYSGLTFYIYNELATMTLTKISAITQSVANTAKRVVVIVGCALVFHESISGLKAIGCFICIAGVFIDSIIDDLLAPKPIAPVETKKTN
jgi:solute carrier family 35 protein E1